MLDHPNMRPPVTTDEELIERFSNVRAFFFVTQAKKYTVHTAYQRSVKRTRIEKRVRPCFICERIIELGSELCIDCFENIAIGIIPNFVDKSAFIDAKTRIREGLTKEYVLFPGEE